MVSDTTGRSGRAREAPVAVGLEVGSALAAIGLFLATLWGIAAPTARTPVLLGVVGAGTGLAVLWTVAIPLAVALRRRLSGR